jgi:hypothetical protein
VSVADEDAEAFRAVLARMAKCPIENVWWFRPLPEHDAPKLATLTMKKTPPMFPNYAPKTAIERERAP